MKEKFRRSSIGTRMFLVMGVVLLLQTGLITGSIIGSGAIERLSEDSYDIFNQQIITRKNYLEYEMISWWSNLMEAEQEYVEAERQYSDLRNQVCFLLQRLDDPMNADILRLRYVEHKRMPAIAKELHLSRSSIYSRHEIALSELQGILQTQST